MATVNFPGTGPARDDSAELQELRDEVASLRQDLKTVMSTLAQRDRDLEEIKRRMSTAVQSSDPVEAQPETGPLRDGRLRNSDLAKQHNVKLRTTHGIMPALDIESLDEVRRVIEKTTRVEGVVAYKFGLTTVLRHGLPATVQALRNVTDLPLIYDHQKAGADVPDMAAKFAKTCADAGADGVILFPVAGPRAVSQFVSHSYKHKLLPVVGGDLPLPEYNIKGGGFIADDALIKIIERCVAMQTDHFVVPATTLPKLRGVAQWLTRKLEVPFLFLPGIGALGGSISDAFKMTEGCRTYAVVGRAVYGADDPAEAAKRLAGEALTFA